MQQKSPIERRTIIDRKNFERVEELTTSEGQTMRRIIRVAEHPGIKAVSYPTTAMPYPADQTVIKDYELVEVRHVVETVYKEL